jgi:hypothetical protein
MASFTSIFNRKAIHPGDEKPLEHIEETLLDSTAPLKDQKASLGL